MFLGSAAAQQPAAPPAQPQPMHPRLKELLEHWEKDAGQTQSLYARLKQTRKNPVFPNAQPEEKEGWAKFMKLPDGNVGAHLYLVNPMNPNDFDRIVFTGTHIYQFRPQEKTLFVIPVAPQQGGKTPDDGPLPFLFGMRSETATKRYQFAVRAATTKEQAEWYTYVQVTPNFARDQADFSQAELTILNKDTSAVLKDMPKRIYYTEPGKVQVTWIIEEMQRNPVGKVERRDFMPPDAPKDWRRETQAQQAAPPAPGGQPRVIRNQSPN
jgi:TIGR03009 family protein